MFNDLIAQYGSAENLYIVMGAIFAVTIIFCAAAYLLISTFIFDQADKRKTSEKLKKQNEILIEEMLRVKDSNKSLKSAYNSLDNLLAQSQLKYKFHFNIYYFLLFTIEFAVLGSVIFYTNFGALLSILGFACFACLPYLAILATSVFIGKAMKGQVLSLIPILINNAKVKRGDVFLTIKESAAKVKAPMSYYLSEFVGEFESGIEIAQCFENLRNKVNDKRFMRLVDALEIHMIRGGNVVTTLNNLQKEFLAREIEEDRHKKESFANTIGIYACIIANFVIVFMMSKTMPEIIGEIQSNDFQIYLFIAGINILISIYIAIKSSTLGMRRNEKEKR